MEAVLMKKKIQKKLNFLIDSYNKLKMPQSLIISAKIKLNNFFYKIINKVI